MSNSRQPHLTSDGVAFSVSVDYVQRDCIITDEALKKLSVLGSAADSEDSMKIFHAYEAKINGIARRLVAAGVQGTPLRVNANSLVGPAPSP
ncbi:MAG: DUF1488 family protein [Burkholderiaceae bacterium]